MRMLESIGYRMVSRFLPQVTAAAGVCSCDPGYGWCRNKALSDYCRCNSDCKSTTCWCNPAGCGN